MAEQVTVLVIALEPAGSVTAAAFPTVEEQELVIAHPSAEGIVEADRLAEVETA